MIEFLWPLILTIIIEFIVYLIAIRKNVVKLFLYSLLINGFTNPLANLVNSLANNPVTIIYIEVFVIIVETFLIKFLLDIKYWKAVLISIIANVTSYILGFLILSFLHLA